MWKKVISLFLVLCMLTSLIGCGVTPQISPDNGNNEEDFQEDLVEEEKDFNVIAEEGGIFEFTDGTKVEIGANTLNMDAILSFKKLDFNINKSNDFNIDVVMYEIKFTEQNVKILESIKISLPIPSEMDTSNIAVIRFYNEDNYEIIEGYISSKSNSNFVTIETEELGKFAVIEGDIDETDIIYKSSTDIVNVLLEAGGYYIAGDYYSLSLLFKEAKNEEQDALNILKVTPGLNWDEHGEELLVDIGISAATCVLGMCIGLLPEPIITKIAAVVLVVAALYSTIHIVELYCETVPAQLAFYSYIVQYFKLEVVSFFYEKISLEVETSLANYNGQAPLEVEFTGFVSGGIAPYTYKWDFGDGNWSEEYTDVSIKSLHYIYEVPGEYKPVLHVEDNEGREGQAEAEKVVVSESNINGEIYKIDSLDDFELAYYYTSKVYVKNTGNVTHTFTVKGVESPKPNGLYFKDEEGQPISLEAGESDYLSFDYICYGGSTEDRTLIFRLYKNANDDISDYIDQMTKTIVYDSETLPAPTGVDASDGTYTDKVKITWNSVSGASYYRVYQADSETGPKEAITSWQSNRYYYDYDITPGTHYFYFVKAATSNTGDDASPYSDSDEGWAYAPPPDTTLPAPTGVDATDGTYTDKVKITWDSVSGASHYHVYRATSSGGTKTSLGSWQTSAIYYDYDITQGTHYFYFVKAATSSSGDNASPYSDYDEGWAYLDTTLSAPTGVDASDGTYTDKVYITWDSVSGASHYKVYRATSETGNKTAITSWQSSRYYSDYDVTQDNYYYYFVKAATSNTGDDASAYSSYNRGHSHDEGGITYTLTTSVSPSGSGYVSLSPSGGTYAAGITVLVQALAYAGYTFDHWGGDFAGTSSSWTNVTMSSNKNVIAYFVYDPDDGGGTDLSAPTGVDASDGQYNYMVRITWNSVSGASHYKVYRSETTGGTKTPISSWQTNTSFDDSTVDTSTYYYWVKAATSSTGDNESPYSDYDEGHRSKRNYGIAIFVATPAAYGTTSPPPGIYSAEEGSTYVITALPSSGYTFDYWSGDIDGSSTAISTYVIMDGEKVINAYFK